MFDAMIFKIKSESRVFLVTLPSLNQLLSLIPAKLAPRELVLSQRHIERGLVVYSVIQQVILMG